MKNKRYMKVALPRMSHAWCWKVVMSIMLVLSSVVLSYSQITGYSFSQSTGVYTPITGGTVLGTATAASGAASLDDVIYNLPAATIPFTFTFNGTGYTGLNVSTNGFITFGATAPGGTNYTPISNTALYSGAIAAYGGDLNSLFNILGNTGELRYETVGSSPNQEFVIQWKNFRPFSSSTSTTVFWRWNFQIRLHQNNTVNIVYDANFVGAPAASSRQVGLRGASNAFATNVNNRLITTGTHTWNTSVQGTANSSTCAFSTTNLPVSGKTFTWSPPNPCLGTPGPGNTISSANPVCSGSSFNLSLQNATPGTGVNYQWESSPDGSTWSPIGTNTATISVSQISDTYYHCIVTCTASGFSGTSSDLLVTMLTPAFPQDFEATAFPPCQWTNNNVTYVARLTGASGFGVGTAAVRFNFFNAAATLNLELTTHTFTPTTGSEALLYDYAYADYTGAEVDTLEILYSDDAGANWYSLVMYEGGDVGPLNTAGTTSSNFIPTAGQWASNSITLPANTNKLMFRGRSDFGNNLWLDNITLGLPPACNAPSGISATNVTGNSADINWSCTGCSGTFVLEYGTAGFSLGTGTVIDPATAPQSLSPLSPGTAYDVYIKQVCDGGATESAYAGPSSFSTSPCGSEDTISCGESVNAVITAGSGTWNITTCGFNTPGKEKLYSFTAPTSGVYNLVVSSAVGGYIDYFFKDASLGCDNTGWTCIDDNNSAGTDPFTLTGGVTYLILLDAEGTAGMNHTFSIQCPVAPNCLANPTSPTNGGNACIGNGPVTLSWPSAAGATGYDVYFDPGTSATTLVSANQPGTTYPAGTLTAGSYAWRVVPKNAIGDATGCADWLFTMSNVPSPGDSIEDPIVIASLPASINGNNLPCFQNNFDGATNRGSADVFYVVTTGPCADSLYINTCTSSFDTYLHFLDSTGAELEFDDDDCSSPNGAGSLIIRNVNPATTYYIVVEGFNAADAGTYTLEIAEVVLPSFTYYADSDEDGFGDINSPQNSCLGAPEGYITDNSDCDDLNIAVNPDATEVCNGIDDDCDGDVDEGTIPGTGTISGSPINLCWPSAPGIGSYTITAITHATTYTWTVPTGMFITGGQGTQTITIQWTAAGINPGIIGNVTCIASNACGAGLASTLAIALTTVKPVTPGSISGPTKLCPGSTGVYSVAPVARASYYVWTLPIGVNAVGSTSGNVINVTVDGSYTGGTITAAAGNPCGVSPVRTRAVSLDLPITPGPISGQASGVCGNIGEAYSISSVSNALSYSWSVGAGGSIPGSTTGLSVSVDFSGSLASTVLSVSSVNGCGTSSARNLTITGAPGLPSVISGPTSVCTGATNHYSVSTVVGATSYTWTAPGTIVNGQGTKEIDVMWGASPATGQQITVRASNACGNGPLRTLGGINISFCPRVGTSDLQGDLNAYPNPATDLVTISFNVKADYTLKLIDVTGRIVSAVSNTANGIQTEVLNLKGLNSGVYLVVLETSNGTEQVRLFID